VNEILKAPFPYFGGKLRVAAQVWERFGDAPNYVEPFAGSLAVLLGRPTEPRIETVNDKDCYIANFWRALQADPEAVARWADWPVNEADLQARHIWLVNQVEWRERMMTDPDYFDAKIAGWWVWGISSWIGSGWCVVKDRPNRQLPHLGDAGKGVHSLRGADMQGYMQALANRLRRVRVCCGDWARVMGPSITFKRGITGVFLDPPYTDTAKRCANVYTEDDTQVAHAVRQWALANGDNPKLRIALCGYEGEHVMPDTWECLAWKTQGGYGGQKTNGTNANAHRERIWFSPHCLKHERKTPCQQYLTEC